MNQFFIWQKGRYILISRSVRGQINMFDPRKDERLSDLTIRKVAMRQILIEIEDEAYEKFLGMLELCPLIRVLSETEVADMKLQCDQCMKQAILELKADRVIRRPRDYAWIMAALEQNVIAGYDGFYSSQAFIQYLELLGITDLPDRTTLYRAYNLIDGKYPQWSFLDNPDAKEALRRNNIVVRFRSAFYRAKRG